MIVELLHTFPKPLLPKVLARNAPKVLAIVGCGVQARSHAQALCVVHQYSEVCSMCGLMQMDAPKVSACRFACGGARMRRPFSVPRTLGDLPDHTHPYVTQ